MTPQKDALVRLVDAYAANNIPTPDTAFRRFSVMSVPSILSLARYWEAKAQEKEDEREEEVGDDNTIRGMKARIRKLSGVGFGINSSTGHHVSAEIEHKIDRRRSSGMHRPGILFITAPCGDGGLHS